MDVSTFSKRRERIMITLPQHKETGCMGLEDFLSHIEITARPVWESGSKNVQVQLNSIARSACRGGTSTSLVRGPD